MQLDKILSEVKKQSYNIYHEYLSNIILYGSWARGEAAEGSDVDILLVLKGRNTLNDKYRKLLNVVYDIELNNSAEISVITVSENQYRKNKMPFFRNVKNEGIELSGKLKKINKQSLKEMFIKNKQKNSKISSQKKFNIMRYVNEINQMIEKSKKEFKSAEMLFENNDCEGTVSKCYYSMFHSAQAALLTKDIDPKYFQHKTIISRFGEIFCKKNILPKELGSDFKDAKKLREKADYIYSVGFIVRSEAEKQIQINKNFNETIENYIQKEMQKEKSKSRRKEM